MVDHYEADTKIVKVVPILFLVLIENLLEKHEPQQHIREEHFLLHRRGHFVVFTKSQPGVFDERWF